MLPLLAGVINLLLYKKQTASAVVNVVALLASLVISVLFVAATLEGDGRVLVSQMGNWPAPFGITAIVDIFAAVLLAATCFVSLVAYAYALSQTPTRFTGGFFNTLYPFLICGVNWAFVTGDLFNLFVSFEVMLLASYGILVSGTTPRQMRHAHKYVILNLFASAFFVAGCGWVYGTLGTLNFAEIAVLSRTGQVDTEGTLALMAIAFVFATKAASFPVWFWLPDTYPTMSPALAGLFGGLLTKVGVYALVRLLITCSGGSLTVAEAAEPLLIFAAATTMFIGVLGAVSSATVKQILSIHVISQIGYMIMGIALAVSPVASPEARAIAVAAVLLFIVHNMIVKCALFLCGGMMEKYGGTDELSKLGNLVSRDKWLAVLFLVAALSLVGLPPLSGFFGKFILITQGFGQGDFGGILMAIVATATGTLTLLSMAKIWSYGFWSPAPEGSLSATREPGYRPPLRNAGLATTTVLVIAAVAFGLFAGPVYQIAVRAGEMVVEPTAYVEAALGPRAAAMIERPVLIVPSQEVMP